MQILVLIGTVGINLRPTIALRGQSNVIQIKSNMAAGCHLEKIDMTS